MHELGILMEVTNPNQINLRDGYVINMETTYKSLLVLILGYMVTQVLLPLDNIGIEVIGLNAVISSFELNAGPHFEPLLLHFTWMTDGKLLRQG